MRTLLARKRGLSMDELRLVVFIIRCARLMYLLPRLMPWMQKYLPLLRRLAPAKFRPTLDKIRPEKFVLPAEEQVPPELLLRLIRECKKLLPYGRWTPTARKIPSSPTEFGWEFFLAITSLRLNRGEIAQAGYSETTAVLDEVYGCLFEIGERQQAKKKQRIAEPASE